MTANTCSKIRPIKITTPTSCNSLKISDSLKIVLELCRLKKSISTGSSIKYFLSTPDITMTITNRYNKK